MNPTMHEICAPAGRTRATGSHGRSILTNTVAVAIVTVASLAPLNTAVAAPSETVLYNFNTTDGANPNALVRASNGKFYGTAAAGGANNLGTVFEVTASGVLTTLHAFAGTDGSSPNSLIEGLDGDFYGTTASGGPANAGTIFKITPTGSLTTLHSFSGADGASPNPLIFGRNGHLYGTTYSGGTAGDGVVFSITKKGVFALLYEFSGPDGALPAGALLEADDGAFYGGTAGGGVQGFGTVFKMAGNGKLTTLVANGLDIGGEPVGALVEGKDGNFYGVTTVSYGEVYRMTPAGVTTQLYIFNAYNHPGDAAGFQSGLIMDAAGNFYGANTFGGEFAYGGLFKMTPAGKVTHLHAFYPGGDGGLFGPLIEGPNGHLYAAGAIGGSNGAGVVEEFSRDPIPPTLHFTISPSTIVLSQGNTASAVWEPTDSDTCLASGAWSGNQNTGIYNSITLTFTTPGTYVYGLACTGGGGSVSQSNTVTVTN
jgi:uncharacterized repeat protein (TIGR03803 family)